MQKGMSSGLLLIPTAGLAIGFPWHQEICFHGMLRSFQQRYWVRLPYLKLSILPSPAAFRLAGETAELLKQADSEEKHDTQSS